MRINALISDHWGIHMHVDYRPASFFARSLSNPYATYALGFGVALAVYSLGYSDLYPPLQQSLIWFILLTCAVSLVLAFTIGNIADSHIHRRESAELHFYIFLLLMAVFGAEVIHNGGIPLLLSATALDFNYQDFGIPTVHVAFVGFCYFYAVYWFDVYLLENRRLFLAFAISATSTSLLMFSRGAFIITLLGIVFVYVQRRGLSRRLLQTFAGLAVIITWGFGLLGDLRTHGASGETLILDIGFANDKFLQSNLPTEIFWPYLYVSSPLANLQLNMIARVDNDSPGLYFALEYLPDFVSKRVVTEEAGAGSEPILITQELAVTTMYGRAFILMGWLGLLLSFFYFVVVSIICMRILSGSKYFVSATAILSSLAFLNIFNNMYIFAGGILQVIVALFLHLFERPSIASSS